MIPAIIGLAASAASALGARSAQKSANEQYQRELDQDIYNRELNYARQKEFAQMGIQWKVADAKAAGLHPLYGLGGSTATFSPTISALGSRPVERAPDYHAMGQNISRAVEAASAQDTNEMMELQKQKLKAEIDYTNARTRSLGAPPEPGAAMAYPYHVGPRPIGLPGDIQPWQIRELGQDPVTRGGQPEGIPLADYSGKYSGRINPKPADQVSRHPHQSWRTPSDLPGYVVMETGPGFKRLMPAGNDPWETWSELPWYEKMRIIGMSAGQSGDAWDFAKRYIRSEWMGKSPVYRQYGK